MSCIVLGGLPRLIGGSPLGLYVAKYATTELKITDNLFSYIHFLSLIAAPAACILRT